MPGPNPKPIEQRRTRMKPQRGEYHSVPGVGWQFGPIPETPPGLLPASQIAWDTWMHSWVAAHWTPSDLPGLRKIAYLYDATERGELHRSGELRMLMDTYGITPKGQQDRRWTPPKSEPREQVAEPVAESPYAKLKAV